MSKQGSIKLSEKIATDKSLSKKTPQVALVLFNHLDKSGQCHMTQVVLAENAGVCVNTVRKAVRELEKAGYISIDKTTRYSEKHNRVVRGPNVYHCYIPAFGFMFIPRRVLEHIQKGKVQGASVKVYLYICYRQNNGRAWPSLSKIAKETGLCRKTVCEAKKVLTESGLIHFLYCIKKNKAYSCNSYFLLQETEVNTALPERGLPGMDASSTDNGFRGPYTPQYEHVFVLFLLYLSISKRAGQHAHRTRQGGGVIYAQLC